MNTHSPIARCGQRRESDLQVVDIDVPRLLTRLLLFETYTRARKTGEPVRVHVARAVTTAGTTRRPPASSRRSAAARSSIDARSRAACAVKRVGATRGERSPRARWRLVERAVHLRRVASSVQTFELSEVAQ